MLSFTLIDRNFQTWLQIGWLLRCQPIWSHVRKSSLTDYRDIFLKVPPPPPPPPPHTHTHIHTHPLPPPSPPTPPLQPPYIFLHVDMSYLIDILTDQRIHGTLPSTEDRPILVLSFLLPACPRPPPRHLCTPGQSAATRDLEEVSMMIPWHDNAFRITDALWGEFTGHRWIPITKG